MSTTQQPIAELTHAAHDARQREEITEPQMRERLPRLGIGGRANWIGETWEPLPYPGYAFQAMVQPYAENAHSLPRIEQARDWICGLPLTEPALFPLPTASFHQTVVNTFSADRLQRHLIEPGIEGDFPRLLSERLDTLQKPQTEEPVVMHLIGASLFRTAIGLLGVFPEASHFERVLRFRDQMYGDPVLQKIGLTRTRPFIAHVTLAYLERPLAETEAEALLTRILELNTQLATAPIPFAMPEARLHDYQTLAAFTTRDGYPGFPL